MKLWTRENERESKKNKDILNIFNFCCITGSRRETVSEVCGHCWVSSYNYKGIILAYESICSQTKETSTFSKVKHVKKYILWLYANKIQQEKNESLTLEVDNPLLRLCKRKKNWKWKLICQESPGRKVAALQNWWPQWKRCLVKDGDREGWVWAAQVSLRKVTLLRAVIYHRDRVCIKSAKTKDLWGAVHEKLGAHCRRSHPVESRMHLILPKVTPDTAAEVPARECTLASEHRTFIGSRSVRNMFKV